MGRVLARICTSPSPNVPDMAFIPSVSLQCGARVVELVTVLLAGVVRFNSTLESLSLASNRLSDEAATAIARTLQDNSKLTFLDLLDNSLSDESMRTMGLAMLHSRDSKLHLFQCDSFSIHEGMAELNLEAHSLSAAAAILLAGVIRKHATLTSLNLSRA